MVLAAPGPLLTPPPSSSPPKTPHRSHSAQTRSQDEAHCTGIQYGKVIYIRNSASGNTGETSSTSPHRRTCCVPTPPCILWRAQKHDDALFVLPWRAGTGARRHARGTYLVIRRDVGAALHKQRLHHGRVPVDGGLVQAGPPVN
jgi:hypothetical protein